MLWFEQLRHLAYETYRGFCSIAYSFIVKLGYVIWASYNNGMLWLHFLPISRTAPSSRRLTNGSVTRLCHGVVKSSRSSGNSGSECRRHLLKSGCLLRVQKRVPIFWMFHSNGFFPTEFTKHRGERKMKKHQQTEEHHFESSANSRPIFSIVFPTIV